jgi:GNAT superfamily N-acetyltransferase
MWVDPEVRGSGLGDALVERVLAWARARDADIVELWVTETNAHARALYERWGFVPDGRRQPHPRFAELHEIAMLAPVERRGP